MSLKAQSRTNEEKVTVLLQKKINKVLKKVVSLEAQTRTKKAKITVLLQKNK